MGLLRGEPRKGSTSATARQKKRERQKNRQEGSFRDINRGHREDKEEKRVKWIEDNEMERGWDPADRTAEERSVEFRYENKAKPFKLQGQFVENLCITLQPQQLYV